MSITQVLKTKNIFYIRLLALLYLIVPTNCLDISTNEKMPSNKILPREYIENHGKKTYKSIFYNPLILLATVVVTGVLADKVLSNPEKSDSKKKPRESTNKIEKTEDVHIDENAMLNLKANTNEQDIPENFPEEEEREKKEAKEKMENLWKSIVSNKPENLSAVGLKQYNKMKDKKLFEIQERIKALIEPNLLKKDPFMLKKETLLLNKQRNIIYDEEIFSPLESSALWACRCNDYRQNCRRLRQQRQARISRFRTIFASVANLTDNTNNTKVEQPPYSEREIQQRDEIKKILEVQKEIDQINNTIYDRNKNLIEEHDVEWNKWFETEKTSGISEEQFEANFIKDHQKIAESDMILQQQNLKFETTEDKNKKKPLYETQQSIINNNIFDEREKEELNILMKEYEEYQEEERKEIEEITFNKQVITMQNINSINIIGLSYVEKKQLNRIEETLQRRQYQKKHEKPKTKYLLEEDN